MKELSSLTNNKEIQNLLQPMFTILDEKNIYQGIKLITNNDTISICINEDYLSKTNQIILQNIAHIYNNIISYKDDKNIDLPNTKNTTSKIENIIAKTT